MSVPERLRLLRAMDEQLRALARVQVLVDHELFDPATATRALQLILLQRAGRVMPAQRARHARLH